MQPFTCPQCGHKSSFDPWAETARCPACGFTPPAPGQSNNYIRWAQRYGYQPLLDQMVSCWNGTNPPDPGFRFETQDDAIAFFEEYQRALGEDPHRQPGPQTLYARDYPPNRQEILIFAGAYARLRRGDATGAASDLRALNFTSPEFVDPWVWLTAATGDPDERLRCLEKATNLDAGHPLARDALAIAHGRVEPAAARQEEQVIVAKCAQCGGALRYEPGAIHVTCSFCGHTLDLETANVVDGPAKPVHSLRLQRHFEGHTWEEARHIVACRTCGAELTMTEQFASICAFCGSANVLAQDSQRTLEQPDGLLPFRIDRQQAAEAIRQEQNALSRRIASWFKGTRQAPADLRGIYVPFWVFDGIVEAYSFTTDWATTEKQSLGLSAHENLLLSAIPNPPPVTQRQVFPFHLDQLVPYEPRLLADWPARLYTLDVEFMAEQASVQMISLAREEQTMRQATHSWQATSARNRSWSSPGVPARSPQVLFQVLGTTYQLVLLPMWLAFLEGDGERSLALVNGETGKATLCTMRPGSRTECGGQGTDDPPR